MENDGPYPEPADERFYGIGRGTSPVQPVWDPTPNPANYDTPVGWVAPPGCPENIGYEGNSPGPWKNYGDIVCVGGYGSGFNYRDKSPAQRLDYYRKMIALRTPALSWMPASGDPEGGGLAADVATAQGIFVNYFDCSDSNNPRRKFVFYPAGTGSPAARQFNPDSQDWEDEGFDYDRDLPMIFQGALTAISAVGAVALSLLSVDPAIIAAWSGALGQMAASARPGGKIDPFAYISMWALAEAHAIPDFTKLMSNVALKNVLVSGLYADAQDIVAKVQVLEGQAVSFFTSFTQAVQKNLPNMPKLDLATATALLGGQVPSALTKAAGAAFGTTQISPQNAILKAANAYVMQGEQAFYSVRSLCPIMGPSVGDVLAWRQSFDATYASVLATQTSGVHADDSPFAMASNETIKAIGDPFHGQDPRAPLNKIVATLKKRYGLV